MAYIDAKTQVFILSVICFCWLIIRAVGYFIEGFFIAEEEKKLAKRDEKIIIASMILKGTRRGPKPC